MGGRMSKSAFVSESRCKSTPTALRSTNDGENNFKEAVGQCVIKSMICKKRGDWCYFFIEQREMNPERGSPIERKFVNN